MKLFTLLISIFLKAWNLAKKTPMWAIDTFTWVLFVAMLWAAISSVFY